VELGLELGDGEIVELGLLLGEGDIVELGEDEGEGLIVELGLELALGDADGEVDTLGLEDGDGLIVALGEELGERLSLGEELGLGLAVLLGELLVEMDFCSENEIASALAHAYGLPYAQITPKICDPAVIEILPRDFLEEHLVLPLFKVYETLTVAVSEPSNVFIIDEKGYIHFEHKGYRKEIVNAIAVSVVVESIPPLLNSSITTSILTFLPFSSRSLTKS